MKRVAFMLLCVLFADVVYAQTNTGRVNRGVDAAYEKALRKHNTRLKKAADEAARKEREKARRHEQQRRQHEENYNRQINNLNQVSAEDFLHNNPQQNEGGFNSKVGKSRENQQSQAIVATPKKEDGNRANGNPYGNSGRIGSPSYSGLNYTGNRYDNRHVGFGNTQQHAQVWLPTNQIIGQYKPNRNMRQGVVNLQRTNTMPKVKAQRTQQQRNIAQGSQQQQGVQGTTKGQTLQKQQPSVQQQEKARINENGKLRIDPSKGPVYITIQQKNSSNDLAMVDTRRIDYATKYNNITIYNMPDEAPYLSDRDNKRLSGSAKGLAHDERTQAQQAQLLAIDVANGMSSFDNRKKWEYIYDYGYDRSVKTPARQVTKKR